MSPISHAIDLTLTYTANAMTLAFIAISVWKRCLQRYLYLNIYCLGVLICSAFRQRVLYVYGFKSPEYFYTYFLTDLLLSVMFFMAILSVFDIMLRDSPIRTQARVAFVICFAVVATLSYFAISNSISQFYKHYIIEFQQNIKFTSVVLTTLMCIGLAHLRVKDPRLRVLVSGLGALAGMQAAFYALQGILQTNLSEQNYAAASEILRRIPPLACITMLGLWCSALVRVPELSEVSVPEVGRELEPAFATSPQEGLR
jgi:hypothetical protein